MNKKIIQLSVYWRRLTNAKLGYSQTQLEVLAVFWSVKRLHELIFNKSSILNTHREVLKYIFDQKKRINKNSVAMVKRWSIEPSVYDYKNSSSRQLVLTDLNNGYLGIEKMKSLARLIILCTRYYYGPHTESQKLQAMCSQSESEIRKLDTVALMYRSVARRSC